MLYKNAQLIHDVVLQAVSEFNMNHKRHYVAKWTAGTDPLKDINGMVPTVSRLRGCDIYVAYRTQSVRLFNIGPSPSSLELFNITLDGETKVRRIKNKELAAYVASVFEEAETMGRLPSEHK